MSMAREGCGEMFAVVLCIDMAVLVRSHSRNGTTFSTAITKFLPPFVTEVFIISALRVWLILMYICELIVILPGEE